MFQNPAEFGFWLFSDYIKKKLAEVWNWLWGTREPARRSILIIGPGGTGKSTFGKMLADQHTALLQSMGTYEESIEIETYALQDDPSVEIVVQRGQEARRDITWSSLGNDLATGRFRGIVFVGAYGYHSMGVIIGGWKKHKLYKGNKARFLKAYEKDRRFEELKVLRELAPHILACPARMWMLTLVNKQDLWWPEHEKAERFYREGEYGKEIERLK